MDKFINEAIEAGFTKEQAEFMESTLAKYPHTHDMSEVEGLEEMMDSMMEGEEEEEDDAS